MNQILISEKLYVTPELKKKKKLFKIEFFLSVFLLCILSSYAIYAEYDRSKNEKISQEILQGINYGLVNDKEEKNKEEEKAIVLILNKALEDNEEPKRTEPSPSQIANQAMQQQQRLQASDGSEYYAIGEINIPSINVNYPILCSDTLDNIDIILKISVCKFHGANPNEIGNLCIVGHNYKNSKFFSKVPTMENGDIIEIKDLSGRVLQYSVYDKFIVDPSDVSATTQLTGGKREITLITCTNDNERRYIIKAREIK